MHSYANPQHERRAREICQEVFPGVKVAISSDITGEFREFERTSTVVLNTYVMPRMASYLLELENRLKGAGFSGGLNIMQSTGGMMSSKIARGIPIRTLESGPAGGVIGAVGAGKQLGQRNLIAADVGGTSFDVTLIPDGRPLEKAETVVNRRPVLQATLDIVSVGAGGGSIAWIDDEGSFRVGPQSAEADPGPVCFGQGGTEPTVTDAHLVLGTINPFFFLGKRVEMHIEAAQQAIREKIAKPLRLSLEEAAYGITRLADTNMINAIRQVSVERGHDPRDFALFCYGGGGGLFASSLARELDIPRAIIPPNPAVFSAWGILTSDIREDAVRTWVRSTEDLEVAELIADFGQLANSALEQLQDIGLRDNSVQYLRSVDMRYEGQEHTVRVPVPSDTELLKDGLGLLQRRFDELHEKAYAHASPGTPTEIVNLRCSAVVTMKKPRMTRIDSTSGDPDRAIKERREVQFATDRVKACPIYDREKLGAGDRIDGEAEYVDVYLGEAIANETIPGPRIIASGPGLTSRGVPAPLKWKVDGPLDLRKFIRDNLHRGARTMKLKLFDMSPKGSNYTTQELETIVDELKRNGRVVSADVKGLWGVSLKAALQAGVNVIEDPFPLDEEFFPLFLSSNAAISVNEMGPVSLFR